ncbi:subclass B1 metallo-beta-lactamase [Fodinibius salsisoli]|uniref:beta-lactamase n=1 Tax=Fodinibius salsisoli TaxID=2820877 RepID=A0ABT3PKC8_9BACT|nr:subclass B1 metallo-beta-lactamase [Fodinibius salsisoli]MCW9706396.1 subclass B1 metallo-beta-lactamase [Fodinibius salsisoli]
MTYLLLLYFSLFSFTTAPPDHQIEVTQLEENVYLYESFATYQGQLISANGLVLVSGNEVALIDTPWDESQTRQLLNWIDDKIDKPVAFAVITHAHQDRIGGIDVLKTNHIPTVSGELTATQAVQNGYAQPDASFQSDTLLTYGQASIDMFYPGPGHTVDNTVVYLNDRDILYGGCFIKSAQAQSLGNLADAYVQDWSQSLARVKERYPERKLVIPGHGKWTPGAIENTLNLLLKAE